MSAECLLRVEREGGERERVFEFLSLLFAASQLGEGKKIHARKIHNPDHLLPPSALFSRHLVAIKAPRRHPH